jgi:hypothetical protein
LKIINSVQFLLQRRATVLVSGKNGCHEGAQGVKRGKINRTFLDTDGDTRYCNILHRYATQRAQYQCLDVHESVHRDIIKKVTNKM